ncbi:MAG: NAD+ synthase [Parvularculales bacterium]
MTELAIALAQLNPIVGDVVGNGGLVRRAREEAAQQGADLVVFSELFLSGYPPEDLVLRSAFQEAVTAQVRELAALTADGGPALLLGAPWVLEGKLHNSVVLLDGGALVGHCAKTHLPNYGVFDEKRVFISGPMPQPIEWRGVRLGVPICEDVWFEDVTAILKQAGADLLIVPNSSPFSHDKFANRQAHVTSRVQECALPLIYINQWGGQDELVFDGASFVVNVDMSKPVQLPAWRDCVSVTQWSQEESGWSCATGEQTSLQEGLEAMYNAVMIGVRDYVNKNRFPGVVLGLSGGIDSALCSTIAVDALGAERVWCVMLPSRYTADSSFSDAKACAQNLGVKLSEIAIGESVEALEESLAPLFEQKPPDITEENIQSRIRGVLLMALSNKYGHMVLTTGNKSEVSVGYATLYGDMNGGFNPVKDLYKTQVFALSRWRNAHRPHEGLGPQGVVIPQTIITKPPTAELRENQKDQDSLPSYDVLDDILECLVERDMSVREVVAHGHSEDVVRRVEHLLHIAEYKRRQAAPGVKVGVRHFGRDRRWPLTNAFRDPKQDKV